MLEMPRTQTYLLERLAFIVESSSGHESTAAPGSSLATELIVSSSAIGLLGPDLGGSFLIALLRSSKCSGRIQCPIL